MSKIVKALHMVPDPRGQKLRIRLLSRIRNTVQWALVVTVFVSLSEATQRTLSGSDNLESTILHVIIFSCS
jgi:hypothetical protein